MVNYKKELYKKRNLEKELHQKQQEINQMEECIENTIEQSMDPLLRNTDNVILPNGNTFTPGPSNPLFLSGSNIYNDNEEREEEEEEINKLK